MTPAALGVSRETYDRLAVYVDLLTKWTARINLVSPKSVPQIWTRHIQDSLQILQHAPPQYTHWLDFGSGGGLPGLVLAIVGQERHPTAHVTLVDSDSRKTAFLGHVVHELRLPTEVLTGRIEQLPRLNADVISARAVAALPRLLEIAERHRAETATFLFPKGRTAEEELTAVSPQWHNRLTRLGSITDPTATILRFERSSSD